MAGISAVVRRSGIDKESVRGVFNAVYELLLEGERVLIPKFGTFSIKDLKAITITSGIYESGSIDVPARKTIKFRPSKEARARLCSTESKAFRRENWPNKK